jgi:predicted secreted protein
MTFLTQWAIFEICAWIVLIVFVNIMLPAKKNDSSKKS